MGYGGYARTLTGLGAVLALSACSASAEASGETSPSESMSLDRVQFLDNESPEYETEELGDVATVIDSTLYLQLYGSSSCPPEAEPVEPVIEDDELVEVTLVRAAPDSETACTMDYVGHHYQLTAEQDVSAEITVLTRTADGEDAEQIPVVEAQYSSIPTPEPIAH